jgi:arylsulfatase
VWLPEPIGPQLFPRGHTITATLDIPKTGSEGVVTCAGSFSAGWSIYLKDRKPHFRYTGFDVSDANIQGTVEIPFFRHGLEPFEVGRDSITPIDPAYKDRGTFEFTGKIDKITFELAPARQ